MTITCPKCNTPHDVTGRTAGERITCTCGNVLAVPAASAKKSGFPTWLIVLLILGVLAIPCIGILAAIAIPSFIRYKSRAESAEARMEVRALCTAEVSYHLEHDEWLAAGPAPRSIPGGERVEFPAGDPAFEKLGFNPGRVRYQYEVVVDGDPKGPNTPVRCVARGAASRNGKTSLFEVRIGEDGQLGPVKAEHETE